MKGIDKCRITRTDFSDQRVVIAGGTGAVGEGIVRQWLRTSATVIVPSRTQDKKRELIERVSDEPQAANLQVVVGDYTSFDGASEMSERVTAEFGEVRDVIASIGGWWQGKPLWQVSTAEWTKYFVDFTTAHV